MAEIKESGALTLATQPTQTPTPQVPCGAALVLGRERGVPDDLLPGTHQALLNASRPRPRLLRRLG